MAPGEGGASIDAQPMAPGRPTVDAPISPHLDAKAIDAMFDMGYHTKHVDTVFERVFPGS